MIIFDHETSICSRSGEVSTDTFRKTQITNPYIGEEKITLGGNYYDEQHGTITRQSYATTRYV